MRNRAPRTLRQPPSPITGRGRALSRHRHGAALRSVLLAAVVISGFLVAPTHATFNGADQNPANSFTAGYWGYATQVLSDSPSFWWRLGEAPAAGAPVFTEDFEGSFDWVTYSSGTFTASTAQAHGGSTSGLKDNNNDPNGGYIPLGFSTSATWSFEAWIYRPSGFTGGAADRVALEDAFFDGYGVLLNHNANTFQIERRDGGTGTTVASTSFNPPEDEWYRVTLNRTGSSLTAALYNSGGTQLSTVSGSDGTHGSADLYIVHGGNQYYVDDITVTTTAAADTSVAIDSITNLDGAYTNSPTLGIASLIDGESDTAVDFDGSSWVMLGDHGLLNTSTRSERTAELWFDADSTTGRQVLYEEGGSTNGMVIYLEGTSLRARAWSNSTSWSNQLDTSTTITTGQTYHVVVTLDTANTPNLILYLNGSSVSTASKTDSAQWNAHTDDGGIATQNGSTRYHDNTTGSSGSNGFDGTIDDVAIYNSVLSAARVWVHWEAGTP